VCSSDLEVRHTQDGAPIVTLAIATSDSWKDKATGEKREKTEWHRVVIFNEHLCKVAENYLKKGSKIYIEGSLQTRKWTDNAGVEKYSTEVVLQRYNGELTMLDGRGDAGGYSQDGGSSDNYNQVASGGGGGSAPASEKPGFDDEIPF